MILASVYGFRVLGLGLKWILFSFGPCKQELKQFRTLELEEFRIWDFRISGVRCAGVLVRFSKQGFGLHLTLLSNKD